MSHLPGKKSHINRRGTCEALERCPSALFGTAVFKRHKGSWISTPLGLSDMASAATVDSLPEPRQTLVADTTSRSNRRGGSRKRKAGDADSSTEGNDGRKRTFDDFFNFCSFVLAYEEQLERQALAAVGPTHPPQSTNITTNTKNHTDITTNTKNHTDITTNTKNHTHDSNISTHTNSSTTGQNHHQHTLTTGTSSSSGVSESSESGEEGEEEGRGGDGEFPDSPTSSDDRLEYTSEDESWNLVTCFCRRPFAGRPMIECSKCNTWVHLFCAKIRKSAVPEVYTCPRCLPGKTTATTTSARRPHLTSTPTAN